jgi:hypothetical protein
MVNGIENQSSINRTAEYAKQTADRAYQVENAKAFAAQIEKEKTAREMQSVMETEHSENKRIRREKDRDSAGGGARDEEREKEETPEEALTVMPSDTLGKEIDITV